MNIPAPTPAPVIDQSLLYPSPYKEFWHHFSRNKGAVAGLLFMCLIVFCAVFAPWVAPHNPSEQYRDFLLTPPVWLEGGNWQFILGTDELGRDLLSRLIQGSRLSLLIGLSSVVISLIPGIVLGLLAGFFPKALGASIMRLMDVMLALPSLLLAVAIVAILGPGLVNTVIAIAIVSLPSYVRLTRAAVMGELNRDYVTAARLAGASLPRLMFITVLPNCMAPLIVQATLSFSSAILDAAALGFLGLGVQPPTPEWGTMLASARDYIERAWWVVSLPGLTILLSVLAINLMGDGLRDALDPKLKNAAGGEAHVTSANPQSQRALRGCQRGTGGRRSRPVAGYRRGPGHRRRVRLGQVGDHDGADGPDRRARAHQRRRPGVRRPRHAETQRPATAQGRGQGHGHGLPGPHDRPQPQLHRRLPDRGSAAPAPRPAWQGGAPACIGALEESRDPGPGKPPRRLSPPTVRRHEPAGGDCHGDCRRAQAADRRRADHRPRRDHPGADHGTAAELAERAGHGADPHHPRPRRGRRNRPPRVRDVCRASRGSRPGAGTLRSARPPLQRSAAQGHSRAQPGRRTPGNPARHRSRSLRPAERVPAVAALPVCARQLPPATPWPRSPGPQPGPLFLPAEPGGGVMSEVVLTARDLTRHYEVSRGLFKGSAVVRALNGVSFELEAGKTLAVVGESGCGKSTLARALTLIEEPSSGSLQIAGKEVAGASKGERKQLRRDVQMVFQSPYASLNPRQKIGDQLAEPLLINTSLSRAERRESVQAMMQQVGLRPEHYQRYPHMFSGGQRQRIALARAMMLQPKVLVADEPTSALDVSIQAQVLNLFMDLQKEFNTAYVFISHNLAVVRHVADQVLVMYLGRPAEMGPKQDIFDKPLHPYTQALLSATPAIHPDPLKPKIRIAGELPNPLNPPDGCAFHKRCPHATKRCAEEVPAFRQVGTRQVACHYAEQFL